VSRKWRSGFYDALALQNPGLLGDTLVLSNNHFTTCEKNCQIFFNFDTMKTIKEKSGFLPCPID
jgi:hypothetical protein